MHWKGLFTVLKNADKATKIINISITKIEVMNSIFESSPTQIPKILLVKLKHIQYVWGQDVDRCLKLGKFASTT